MANLRQAHPLSAGILFSHYREMPLDGWEKRWPNFKPYEFASHVDHEAYYHPPTFDAIQKARNIIGKPIQINSAHRSWLRNLAIGGAPLSAHLYIALDVSTKGHNRLTVYKALKKAGFKSFGFYLNFIHADLRPDNRRWYGGAQAKALWQPLIARKADIEL